MPNEYVKTIRTVMDEVYNLVKEKEKIRAKEVFKEIDKDKKIINKSIKILEKTGAISVDHPVVGSRKLDLQKEIETARKPRGKGNVVEEYEIESNKVPVTIRITESGEGIDKYYIQTPELGPGTRSLLNYMADEIAQKIEIEAGDINNPKKMQILRERFEKAIKEEIGEIGILSGKERTIISGMALNETYGLGKVEAILDDPRLEEIAVNTAKYPLAVYHKNHGWLQSDMEIENEEEIYNLASEIGRKSGREISSLNPIMDAHLQSGERVAATLSPITSTGNTITFRKFPTDPWTITQMIDNGTITTELASLLFQAMHYELNVLVAGGTASGKTSMLNALTTLLPQDQRIISIEDTRELFLPEELHWNWIPMTTRAENPEGKGGVSMLDLMVSSLRMRPDRVIVGEVRRKKHFETMFEAMHTGHSVYTTMHADTASQVKRRIVEDPISISPEEAKSLQLVLVQYRNRRENIRRTMELAEVSKTEGDELELNYLYRLSPSEDSFQEINDPLRIYDELNLHTGMSMSEIKEDRAEKKELLDWMVDNEILDIEEVGSVIRSYYNDPEGTMEKIKTSENPDELI